MSKLRGFKLGLLNLLGPNFAGKDYLISINSLRSGSVVIDSQLNIPAGVDANQILNFLANNLSEGTSIDGISLQSSPELTANGFVNEEQVQPDTSNLGLALGLGIPLTLIVIIVIVAVKIKTNRYE